MLFLEQWVNTWWLAWCSKKKHKPQLICLRFLANCLASIAERCGRFPGFCNWDGSGLTGQKDFQNIERNGGKKMKNREKSLTTLLQKAEGAKCSAVW